MPLMHTAGGTARRRHRLVRRAALGLVGVAGTVWGGKLLALSRSVAGHRSYWAEPHGMCRRDRLRRPRRLRRAGHRSVSRPDHVATSRCSPTGCAPRTGQPVRLINLSSGARLADVLDHPAPALAARTRNRTWSPSAIGGNDVRLYDDRPGSPLTLAEVTAALPAGTFIADVPYFMHGRWERDAADAAAVLTRLAERRGLDVVPLHDAQRRGGWQAMFTHFAADWFHPNDRGHRAWADAFWARIRTAPVARPTIAVTSR